MFHLEQGQWSNPGLAEEEQMSDSVLRENRGSWATPQLLWASNRCRAWSSRTEAAGRDHRWLLAGSGHWPLQMMLPTKESSSQPGSRPSPSDADCSQLSQKFIHFLKVARTRKHLASSDQGISYFIQDCISSSLNTQAFHKLLSICMCLTRCAAVEVEVPKSSIVMQSLHQQRRRNDGHPAFMQQPRPPTMFDQSQTLFDRHHITRKFKN